MLQLGRPSTRFLHDRRWGSIAYAAFALLLLGIALMQAPGVLTRLPDGFLLFSLLLIAPLTGLLIGRSFSPRGQALSLAILSLDALVASGLIAITGGALSPLWPALLLVSTAAPLLLPGRWTIALISMTWFANSLFLLNVPTDALPLALMSWALRGIGVALIALVLHYAASGRRKHEQVHRREKLLRECLALIERIRTDGDPWLVLAEIARTVQALDEFKGVTVSRVDTHLNSVEVIAAAGASGRELKAVEGLRYDWATFSVLLDSAHQIGSLAYRVESMPFHKTRGEHLIVFPLYQAPQEPIGLLTVAYLPDTWETFQQELPALELLAQHIGAALESRALRTRLKQEQAALSLSRNHTETLFRIVRTLTTSTDEHDLLSKALLVMAQITEAERGGILLLDQQSGQLIYYSRLNRRKGSATPSTSQGIELARWVIEHRQPTLIRDTAHDTRWGSSLGGDQDSRSALAVPLAASEQIFGVLLLQHAEIDHFHEEHTQIVQVAAYQIATVIAKGRLYRTASQQSKQLEQTIQQREEEISKLVALIRSIADGVVVGDRQGQIQIINPAAEQMLAIAAAEFLGRPMSDLPGMPAQLRRDGSDSIQEQIQVGSRTLRAHYAPVLAPTGEWLGDVVVYHDISREVLADRLKSEFIATASHELRTPLTSIRGYIDLVLLGTLGELTQPQSDSLKVVKTNIQDLVALLDELLDMSKVEAGELRLRREPIDLTEIVYEVGEALYSQFTERALSLAIVAQEQLPKIMADRQRVRQIVFNLVSNACKYTPEGGHVDLVLRNGGDKLRVDVRDNGVGIAEVAREHIFTPFFRADNPLREQAGGTGLGLSITKALVDLHGGEIWFVSREGEGTTFSFTLPLEGDWKPADWLEQVE